jgi:hypothetical protein
MSRNRRRKHIIEPPFPVAMERNCHQDSYVVVKRNGIKKKWYGGAPKLIKSEDQNLGPNNRKGEFIKKVKYKRWSKNPETPGRGVSIEESVSCDQHYSSIQKLLLLK